MERYDIIIIGAGISGLSLAHYCTREGLTPLVIEKDDRTGGTIHSHRVDRDFWIELGAHTCYNSYQNLIRILEDCHILDRLLKRQNVPFRMLVDGRLRSIPSQLNFLELLLSLPRLLTTKKAGQSIGLYYPKVVGRRNFERVLSPALNAVLSQEADDFPADLLFKRRRRRRGIIRKFTLPGGLQTITDSIVSQPGIVLIKGKEAEAVTATDGGFEVTTNDGTRYMAGSLAIATPAHIAARLIRGSFPGLSSRLSSIPVKRVETIGVVVRKGLVPFKPLAGIIPVKEPFYSAVSRDTVIHDEYRGFTFHFREGTEFDAGLRCITGLLGLDPARIEDVVRKQNLVPSLRAGHNRLIEEIDGLIGGRRLLLTGNYLYGMSIEDCVSRSASEFQRLKRMLGA